MKTCKLFTASLSRDEMKKVRGGGVNQVVFACTFDENCPNGYAVCKRTCENTCTVTEKARCLRGCFLACVA